MRGTLTVPSRPRPARRSPAQVAAVVLVVLAVALAGCVGTGSGDDGASPTADNGAGPTDDGSGGNGASGDGGSGSSDGDGPGGDGSAGNDSGSGDGGDGDAGPSYRTPSDAMPEHEPVESGEGFAHFRIEGTADLAFRTYGVDHDMTTYSYNMTTLGDETVVEVVLTWDEEMVDLNLHLLDDRRSDVVNPAGTHGQKWLNDNVCGHIGECTFLFAPNGTTWEHLRAGPELLAEAVPGEWLVEVREQNDWDPASVQAYAGLGDGVPYTLDVWVYTMPTDESHPPQA